jgi:hypothetical protein
MELLPPNIYTSRFNIPSEFIYHKQDIISFTDPEKYIQKFTNKYIKNNNYPIGFLPWKLFISDLIPVDKDENYIYKFVEPIKNIIEKIKTINSINNYEDKKKQFYKYFPNYNKEL